MVRTLHNMYLKDTNHNLHLDNNNLCSLYSRVPWRIWSSRWPQITFNSKKMCLPHVIQLATTMNQLQSKGSEQIPSQTILSPQANLNAITLKSAGVVDIASANVVGVVE
ncbi:hypothetical protein CR513_14905, partial [Mucuna pruriens]